MPTGTTTLSVLVTDLKLEANELTQLGRMVRAIRPFHTAWDGDVLDAVSTNRVASKVSRIRLGLTAAEEAWEAVLSAVAP